MDSFHQWLSKPNTLKDIEGWPGFNYATNFEVLLEIKLGFITGCLVAQSKRVRD
jgi:hypothetical protein